ncbi:hypothetical protein ACW5R3_02075 [Bizionia sp. KMM 8389]
MNFAPNLSKQPTRYDNSFILSVQNTGTFIRSVLYLTKKLFML